MPDVVVVIPTFRRPDRLSHAIQEVRKQIDEGPAPESGLTFEVLVIDNDPARSGHGVAEVNDARYVSEARPGIAAVRNRALVECSKSRAIVFIDDDEVPQPAWLKNLVAMYLSTDATAVAGKVVTLFPSDVDPWVAASGAFLRPTRTQGQSMREAATNNLLIDVAGVHRLAIRFDERFGLTGGSDSMFTRQLTARGGTIRWAEDAVVTEQEEAIRFTRRWVLMRTFRFGNTAARVDIALAESAGMRVAQRLRAAARGSARIAGGGARWVRGAVLGSLSDRARGERTVYRGAGMLAASFGHAHDEYGRRRRADGA